MNKFLPFIIRKSSNIFIINNVRFDARAKETKEWYGSPLRRCLSQYYHVRNPALKRLYIDSLVCKMLNNNHKAAYAFENQTLQLY